ncbi:MAG TPA: hypothetical protein DD640_02590 [Clostridiales bacterium]|nr:hypothetical protein [Clostridiales bacterium]
MSGLLEILEQNGPLTGKEISARSGLDLLDAWKGCCGNPEIIVRTVGERYLRFDKRVEGYARLSPSIIREFASYTVAGLVRQASAVLARAEEIHQEILSVSRQKFLLARDILSEIVAAQEDSASIREHACFILSGDVAHQMAHREPRPEFSSGKLVNGSDLDIVVLTDCLPDEQVQALDAAIFAKKVYLLRNPTYREEIDYVIKDLAKARAQLDFDGFEAMVASKVLDEGLFLCGSERLFGLVKDMITDKGIPGRLAELREKAAAEREIARAMLLETDGVLDDEEVMQLFFSSDEREEFF